MDERGRRNEERLVSNAILLDTNIAIGLLNSRLNVVETIQSLDNKGYHFYFSVITKCELMSGAKTAQEINAIMNIEDSRFIEVNNEIAMKAGEIRRVQKQEASRAIKTPDALIVATAIIRNCDLYTLDKGMFFAKAYGVRLIESN